MKIENIISKYKGSFKEDMTGGLLAAIIGLPMGLAFGIQSGLGATAGIYTAIILAIIASVAGGTKTLITDPTGPMTVVAATVISSSIALSGDLTNAIPLIIATFVLAGVFELFFGIIDLGKHIKLMPYPVLSGFMAGIGLIIISVQIFPLLGQISPKGFLEILLNLSEGIANTNGQALFLGSLTIAIVYLLPFITKKIPSILAALILCSVVSVVFGMNVPIIGTIPKTLPTLHLGVFGALKWSDLSIIVPPAIMIGGLGVIDTLLTSVVADNLTKTQHNSRKTIIGQGIGNIIVGLFGGIPGAGATMGTVTNIKAGAKTKLSGIMKGVFLLFIIVGITEYVQYIPMSVLAGILITIGVGIIDYKGIKMLFKIPKQDAIVWAIVLLVTVFDNLLNAVAAGFVLSAIFFIGKMSKSMANTQQNNTDDTLKQQSVLPRGLIGRVHIQQIEGPLFFGTAERFRSHAASINPVEIIILNLKRVPFSDQSGLKMLERVIENWQYKHIQVYLVGTNKQVLESLNKVKMIPNLIPLENCYYNLESALLAIQQKLRVKSHISDYQNEKKSEKELELV